MLIKDWKERTTTEKVLLIIETILVLILIYELGFISGWHWVKYYG